MMRRIRSYARWLVLTAALLLSGGCSKNFFFGDNGEYGTVEYVNVFACNAMNTFYLWADEIKNEFDLWNIREPDPVGKVESLRYKDADGHPVDKWTELFEDFDVFNNYVTGNRKSYGFSYKFFYANAEGTRVLAVVTYTYADGPARKAGLQRGDEIWEVNGKKLTPDNYAEISAGELQGGDQVTLTLADGSQKTLTAVQMYENPVQLASVIDLGDKKTGYLHYTSFTLDSCQELIEICKDFKAQHISDLILDLRYNGGGYAFTEEVLASMLAPEANVTAGDILSTEVYNSLLTKVYGEQKTPLATKHPIKIDDVEYEYDTEGANLGITNLYAIVDSGTASASESLLCELYPYLNITILGNQTRGKFCSGLMIRADEWYEKNAKELGDKAKGKDYVSGWGLYVMYSRYADRDGVTRCMPDGLVPDYVVRDNPSDGHQLGDPQETMLAAALALAGGSKPDPVLFNARSFAPVPVELPLELPCYRIVDPVLTSTPF